MRKHRVCAPHAGWNVLCVACTLLYKSIKSEKWEDLTITAFPVPLASTGAEWWLPPSVRADTPFQFVSILLCTFIRASGEVRLKVLPAPRGIGKRKIASPFRLLVVRRVMVIHCLDQIKEIKTVVFALLQFSANWVCWTVVWACVFCMPTWLLKERWWFW